MSTARKILILTGSMMVTVLLVIGVARLPVSGPVRAALNVTLEQWLHEPFETALERELDNLLYQQHRPMLYHLAMLQVAEQARLARLQAISRADRHNWGRLVPGALSDRVGFAPATGRVEIYQVPATSQHRNSRQDLLLTLACFALAIVWIIFRRSKA